MYTLLFLNRSVEGLITEINLTLLESLPNPTAKLSVWQVLKNKNFKEIKSFGIQCMCNAVLSAMRICEGHMSQDNSSSYQPWFTYPALFTLAS